MKIIVVLFSILFLCTSVNAQSWAAYRDTALALKQSGNIDSALYFFTLAQKKLPKDSAWSNTNTGLLKETGNAWYAKGQYEKALPFYQQAGRIIAKRYGTGDDNFAENIFIIGQLQYLLKQNAAAERSYLSAKNTWEKHYTKISKQYAGACNALGILYNDWSKFDKSLEQHSQAAAIRQQLFTKNSAPYAQSLNNLGAAYWNLGQLDKAEPLALEAKQLREKLADVPRQTYAISCVSLGNIYRDMGKFSEAEKLYLEAAAIREKKFTKQHDVYIQTIEILANLYFYMKKYEDAEKLYLEAKSLRETNNAADNFFYAQCCSNLAQVYLHQNKSTLSLPLALTALGIFEKTGRSADADKAITQNLLGAVYFDRGDHTASLSWLSKARKYWQKSLGTGHPFFNDNTLAMARVYRATNDIKKADALYRMAFESRQNKTDELFSFTAEKEKKMFTQNVQDNADEYLSFYYDKMQQGNNGYPLYILLQQKSRILSSARQLRNTVYNSNDTLLIRLFNDWLDVKKQLSSLYYRPEKTSQTLLEELSVRATELEKKLFRQGSLTSNNTRNKKPDWKQLQSYLSPGETAVEFFDFNYFNGHRYTDTVLYAALVIKNKEEEPQWVNLFNKKTLDSLLSKKYVAVQPAASEGKRGVVKLNPAAVTDKALYETVWKPLDPYLKNGNKLMIAPAGLLNRISFASLKIDSAGLLSDRYQLRQVLSFAQVKNDPSISLSGKNELYLFGGIDYDAMPGTVNELKTDHSKIFDELPGTEKEIRDIKNLDSSGQKKIILFEKEKATEASFKKLDGIVSAQVLHIASHGFYIPFSKPAMDPLKNTVQHFEHFFAQQEDPLLRCGVAFAGANHFADTANSDGEDGILTAYEISNMNLSNTRLVVLSACETALGDIDGSEGVYGLQRAFKMAGVQNIIMSLWAVPDAETALFMRELYKNIFNGEPVDNAFHLAQENLKKQFRTEPEKWAAWILFN